MIVIAGKNEIAVNALEYLIEELNIAKNDICIVTNKTDDGINSWQPSLKQFASKKGILSKELHELYGVEDLLFLSLEFDKIIKPHLFKSKRLFNIHFSLLPKYKGMFTSVMPLLAGEDHSGVTLHRINKGIDTGEIVDQLKFYLSLEDNAKDLYNKYLSFSFILFKKNINNLLSEDFLTHAQPAINSSYYSKNEIDFTEIKIDFNKTAFEIHNQIRAFTFRDYQLPSYNDFKVFKSELTKTTSDLKSGELILETEAFFEVSTIDYSIKLYKDYYNKFWISCIDGNIEQVKRYLPFISDINLQNQNGWNAIILATYKNHIETVQFLVANGADITSTNYKGTSVLMYSKTAKKNNKDSVIMDYILSLGVNINHVDDKGLTILDYAKINNTIEMCNYLISKGAK